MRFVALLAGLVCMTGCASGMPMGGRVAFENMRYRPATPASAPRPIPEPIEAPEPSPAVVTGSPQDPQ